MEKDLISVILPIYNVEKYLSRCLDSVIGQTHKNIEIILVDDGSTDNSYKICEEYAKNDKRIVIIHKENGGLSDARNVGIKKAKGDYITLIDSDDYVEKDYVEFLYKLIKDNNSQMSVCGHTVLYENGKKIKKETHEHLVLSAKKTLEKILYDDGIDLSAWAKMYEKKLFDKVQYPKGRYFEDSATTYLLVDECKKIAVGSESKYNYIIRNNSITTALFSPKKMELITSTEEMTSYVKSKYPDLKAAAERRLMYAYLSTLSQLANSKFRHKKEENELMKYIKLNRKNVLKNKRLNKRDRVALYTTMFGFSFFKFIWFMYGKLTKRK